MNKKAREIFKRVETEILKNKGKVLMTETKGSGHIQVTFEINGRTGKVLHSASPSCPFASKHAEGDVRREVRRLLQCTSVNG